LDEELEFGEWLDRCIETAKRKLGLSWEQIEHRLSVKTEDIHTTIKLGGTFLVNHMD